MVFDFDDFAEDNHKFNRLDELKQINPDFKVTLFTVPGKCSEPFLYGLLKKAGDWIELAVHGWLHPTPYECQDWSKDWTNVVLDHPIIKTYFVTGFKAPGWQISDGTYEALLERGWWVADQHLEDARRPAGLPTYFYEDGNWHGHIQDWGSNGIDETWPELTEAVRNAESFEFASEVASTL